MSIEQPLVSMITYCYNGEGFLDRYFRGVLSQTYRNLELIFIDNGSEDRTSDIVQRYLPMLEAREIHTEFIRFEKNQSTCSMKMLGFQKMRGDFFFGCDSDDVLHPTYVEEMVGYLISHPEKGLVFCQLNTIAETTGQKIGLMKIIPQKESRAAFVDMLSARNVIFTPISYMMSRDHFLRINPEMKIYNSLYGENYQVILPFLYHDLQGYIEKPLGDYYVRDNSYSGQMKRDPIWQINAYEAQENSIRETLNQIHVDNREQYDSIYQRRLRADKLFASLNTQDHQLQKTCFHSLRACGGAGAKEYFAYYFRPLYLYFKENRRKGSSKQ